MSAIFIPTGLTISKLCNSADGNNSLHHCTSSNACFEFKIFAELTPSNHRSFKNGNQKLFRVKCSESESVAKTILSSEGFEGTEIDGNGDGGDDLSPPGGGGSGGGGEEGDDDEDEFGPIMKYEDVMKEAEIRGANLPPDMLEAAKTTGLRELILARYLDFQVKMHVD